MKVGLAAIICLLFANNLVTCSSPSARAIWHLLLDGDVRSAVAQDEVEEARQATKDKMRGIVIGLHMFHKKYQALPALYSKSKEDKPLLSWRVHLLPFIDHEELYKEFHLDEPWDSDHNKTLIAKMPNIFAHPSVKLEPGRTVFLAVQGKDSIWFVPSTADTCPTGIALIHIAASDQIARTGALVEVKAEHSVAWTEPSDLDIDQDGFLDKLSDTWEGERIFSMCDGSTHSFKADLGLDELKSLFKFNDGGPTAEALKTMKLPR